MQRPELRYFEQCEKEPLQFSGAIQQHGSLLISDAQYRITNAAENLPQYLPGTAREWLGKELPDTLRHLTKKLPENPGARVVSYGLHAPFLSPVDVVLTRGPEQNFLVELFLARDFHRHSSGRHLSAHFADANDMQCAHEELVNEVRAILGFARTLFYHFRDDGDGEVVAEARREPSLGSYLGLRFPGTDIPSNARALYMKNPYRLISDAQADPATILGHGSEPPDLSCSDLRSASPFHRVYMTNMGVRASLSYPVAVGRELYALVTAHHDEPVTPVLAAIEEAARRVRAHALSIAEFSASERVRLIDGLSRHFHGVYQLSQNVLENWPSIGRVLMNDFAADGAMLLEGGVLAETGLALEPEAVAALMAHLNAQPNDPIWQSDSLSRSIAEFPYSQIAGALVVRSPQRTGVERCIVLTRAEFVQEVAWGGNPNKPVDVLDGAYNISPRRSFEKWIEKKMGYSRSWTRESKLLGFKLRELLQAGAL